MRRQLHAVVALLLVTVVGCGVSEEAAPRGIDSGAVPFGLLEPRAPSTTSTTAAVPRVTIEVFFVAGDRLTTVRREVAAAAVLSTALDAVEAGPSDAEASAGLRNALPEDAVTRVTSSSSVANVDLAASFAAVDPAEQLLAIAQIVFTASAVTGVDSVAFSVEGRPAEVPIDGASLVSRPVARSDYTSVAPVS